MLDICSTCCGECKILFFATIRQQQQQDATEQVAQANLVSNEPLVPSEMNDFKDYINILGEDELRRMKSACLEMQQELSLWPLPRHRSRVSRATLRRQDEMMATLRWQDELRTNVDDQDDGFVTWGPLPRQPRCFNCESVVDGAGWRMSRH